MPVMGFHAETARLRPDWASIIFIRYLIQCAILFTIDVPFPNPAAVWREIKLIGDSVSLYPAGFDVERIRNAMRNTKLLSASKMKGATTYKWQLILDGNQRVMFKPRIRYLMCCVCVCVGGGLNIQCAGPCI